MGCDIHMMAELRRRELENKQYDDVDDQEWQAVTKKVFKNDYYRKEDGNKYPWNTPKTSTPYYSRNYKLFGFLADVRNGYGFAGTDTGDYITPIADCKGVPSNASVEWKAECYYWSGDMHSQSYFTLAELEAADWTQPVVARYYISPADYAEYKKSGKQADMSWGGGSGVHVTAAEFDAMPESLKEDVHGVQIEETKPISAYAHNFYTRTMPELAKLADKEKVTHDDIRIVFGFDN